MKNKKTFKKILTFTFTILLTLGIYTSTVHAQGGSVGKYYLDNIEGTDKDTEENRQIVEDEYTPGAGYEYAEFEGGGFLEGYIPETTSNISTKEDAFAVVLNVFLGAAMSISLIGLILSGIKYMSTRSGDPRQLETAKKALTYSIVALILSIGAFSILNIILRAIGGSASSVFQG